MHPGTPASAAERAADVELRDNIVSARYELWLGDDLVGVEGYEVGDDGSVTLLHTVITEKYGRAGYARLLVTLVLDDARRRHLAVRPVCSYVQRYLDRFPGRRDVVAPEAAFEASSGPD